MSSRIARIADALGPYGVWPLARKLTRHQMRIFMFHRFSGEPTPRRVHAAALRAQVECIREHFDVITFATAVERITKGAEYDRPTVCLTVDDGYRDFYDHAFPVLREYRVPCTVFVTAGFVEGAWFWADAVEYLLGQAPAGRHSVEVLGERISFKLGTPHELREAWRAIAAPLVFNNEERAPTIERLQKLFSIELPQQAVDEFAAMTWDQLREISAGGIEVGGHSWTHAFLPALQGEALHTELVYAKTRLEEELGRPVRTFAYPNGSKRDYTPELAAAVSRAGYVGAAVAYNPEGDNLDPLRLGRWPGGVNMTYFNNVLHGMTQLKRRVGTALARA